MDPNLLKNIDYFAVPNAQTGNPIDQIAGESSAAQATANTSSSSIWDPPIAPVEPGVSDEYSAAYSLAQQPQTTAPPNLTFGSLSGPSPYVAEKNNTLPARAAQSVAAPRRREGHERKRAKVNSEAAALESVDYWIQFDDDENDKGGSFEIDFSKRQNARPSLTRAPSSLNTISTTPGLGTGLYSNTSASHLKDDIDDSALDNALSDDDDDGIDSINLRDQLAKIESIPPSEVPPREGLYSTPLSWEKPQPGLRTDPLLGAMPSGGGILTDAEQRRLLAIAMNAGNRPQLSAYQPGYPGFGFGYPGLAGGFPTLGAQNLLDSTGLGTTISLSELSKPLEKPRTQSSSQQPQPQKQQAQAPTQSPQPATSAQKAGGEKENKDKDLQKPQLQRTNTGTASKAKEKVKAGDRTAHNDIERKYRTNLKDRIADLRDAVPALRAIPEDGAGDDEQDSARAPKVSKGTVLTKATEYIHFLERRNKAILREHQELSRRLQAFEQLLNVTARQPFPMPSYSRTLFDPRGFC